VSKQRRPGFIFVSGCLNCHDLQVVDLEYLQRGFSQNKKGTIRSASAEGLKPKGSIFL
jgi:hypothetical protein